MFFSAVTSSRRVLEPYDRVSEVLFGLIMVLAFTGSLSVAEAGRDDIRVMLIGALGCNLVWGIIDGVLYLMGCLADQAKELAALRAVRAATDPEKAHQQISESLPSWLAPAVTANELEVVRLRLLERPEPPPLARLNRGDWLGGVWVFLLVFLSTFPVALPFVFMERTLPALRLSNAIAIVMLFGLGCAFGRITGRRPWVTGAGMVALGTLLVGLTIALGG